ncbi:transposase [Clostridioides difficile]|nr:transposase [Clostridioides difficile]
MLRMIAMITVRKLKLTIVGDEEIRKDQYKFIRDSQYAQYQGLNLAMGILTSSYLLSGGDVKSDYFKDAQKSLKNSNKIFNEINFGKGIDSKSHITQKVKKDFSTSLKNGLAKGERGFTNYKRDFPLMTRGRDLKFYEEDKEFYIKWVNKIIFKVIIGRKDKNKVELIHTLNKVLNKEYKLSQSSLQFNKNNNLILNLTIDVKSDVKVDVIKDRVCGVGMGINTPIYVALNDILYISQSIGSNDELIKQKKQFEARRKRIRERVKNKKELNLLKEKERNWINTYNHMLSKKVIEFAKKNKCEYVYLEKINDNEFKNKALKKWPYCELQKMIRYKAVEFGVEVKYVNSYHIFHTCSRCGYEYNKNIAIQKRFKCLNCGLEVNFDYNIARNISKYNIL